jgi:hypothetical protein
MLGSLWFVAIGDVDIWMLQSNVHCSTGMRLDNDAFN